MDHNKQGEYLFSSVRVYMFEEDWHVSIKAWICTGHYSNDMYSNSTWESEKVSK